MATNPPLQSQIVDPEFSKKLSFGKYSKWAKEISSEEFIKLVAAIGELGELIWPSYKDDDKFIKRLFENVKLPNTRGIQGLGFIVKIQSTGRLDWEMPSGWDGVFSNEGSAFKEGFRNVLSNEVHTKWAGNLPIRLVALLLWMTGEFCVRVSKRLEGNEMLGGELSKSSYRIKELLLMVSEIYFDRRRCDHIY